MPVPIEDYYNNYNIKPALIDSNNRNPSASRTLPVFRKGENLFTNTGSLWCMDPVNQAHCVPDKNYILQPDQTIDNTIDGSISSFNPAASLDNNSLSISNLDNNTLSISNLDRQYRERVLLANQRCIEARYRPVYLHIPEQFLEICQPQGYEQNNPYYKLS